MKFLTLTHKAKEYLTSNMRRSWIVSYIIILLLPLLINSFVYVNAYTTIKQQAQDSQKSAVERLRSNMDNEFRRLEESISLLSYNTNLNFFLDAQGLESFKQNYATASRLYDLNESLALNMPSDRIISDYYIFSPKNSLVFHNSGVNEISRYGDLASNDTKLLYEKCQTLDTRTVQLFSFEPEPGRSYMVTVYPLPYSYLPKGYIAVLMDNTELNSAMQNLYSQENSQIYLVDETYTFLGSQAHLSDRTAFAAYDFTKGSVLGRLPGDAGKSLMYSSESRVLPFYYICTDRKSVV